MSPRLNFQTLSESGRKGRGLQYLMEDIGLKFNYTVELGGGGADEGRDLFFQYELVDQFGIRYPQKILVDCKDHSAGGADVTVSQIGNYVVRISQHSCTGFLLVTTTDVTDDLVRNIRETAEKQRFGYQILRGPQLEALLISDLDKFKLTLARFFPAFAQTVFEGDSLALRYMFRAMRSLDHDESIDLVADMLSQTTDDLVIWQSISQAVETLDCSITDVARLLSSVENLFDRELKKALADVISDLVEEWAEDNFESSEFYEELLSYFSRAEMAGFDGVEIEDITVEEDITIFTMSGTVKANAFFDRELDDHGFKVSCPCSFTIEVEHGEPEFRNVNIDANKYFSDDDTSEE